jgi:hypothetical protein
MSYRFARSITSSRHRQLQGRRRELVEKWEELSKQRAKPMQVPGWVAGDKGSTLRPDKYMELAGPWAGGKDPSGT